MIWLYVLVFWPLQKTNPEISTIDLPKFPYVKDIIFYPNYDRVNDQFMEQIYKNQVYCDLNLILSQSYVGRFANFQEAVDFVEMALRMLNHIFERQFSWDKDRPMVVYTLKSVHVLSNNNTLTSHIDQPEKLLKLINEMYASSQQHYCQNMLLTAEDWGDVLGVAFQDLVSKPQGSLCETPSSFVLTSLMKGHFINHATLAYLMAHEIAHTLCADHDVINVRDKTKQIVRVVSHSHYFKRPLLIARANGSKTLVIRHFIMDAGTGMVPEYVLPEFSYESTNVIAQCLFVKGAGCFKKRVYSVCGNGIVESGEQCDSNDHCCHPPGTPLECTFVSGAVCSASQPCCDNSCQFERPNVLCHFADECSVDSYCSGKQASCVMEYSSAQQHIECGDGRALCDRGKCNATLCLKFNQNSCSSAGSESCLIKCYNTTTKSCEIVRNGLSSKPLFIPNGWSCGGTSAQRGTCNGGRCLATTTHSFYSDDAPYKYVSITFVSLTLIAILATLYIGYMVHNHTKNRAYNSKSEIQN